MCCWPGEPTRSEGEGEALGDWFIPRGGLLRVLARVGWPWGDLAQHGRIFSRPLVSPTCRVHVSLIS